MSNKRRTVFMEEEWEVVERIKDRFNLLSLSAALRYIVNQFEEQQTVDEQDKKEDEKQQTAPT